MNTAHLQALEACAFAAWPSARSSLYKGWRLRLDHGYTKRANSLNGTAHSQPLDDIDLDAIESRFHQHRLVPTVRLISFGALPEADGQLAERGYRLCDPSLVMTRPLAHVPTEPRAECPQLGGAEAWLEAFGQITGKGSDTGAHARILQRIVHPVAWAGMAGPGGAVCCGLGVVVDGHLGLFDIATHPSYQRQGLARALCSGLLAWAQRQGAHTAYLQVVASNAGAVALYQRLGFEVAYRYWYRVAPAT